MVKGYYTPRKKKMLDESHSLSEIGNFSHMTDTMHSEESRKKRGKYF
jgi:hypothetical protein